MSRIGKLPVAIPAGVDVKLEAGNVITVKGPKGTLTRKLADDMNIAIEDGHVVVTRPNDLKRSKSLHGLTRTLINNMIIGVTQGYEKDQRCWLQSCKIRQKAYTYTRIFTSG